MTFRKRFHPVVIGLLMLAVAALAVPAFAQEMTPVPQFPEPADFPNNTITVSGIGVASGEPDIAFIELGVEMVDPDLATAFAQAAETMQNVTNALTEMGIDREDIRTSSVNIFPQEQFNPETGGPGERTYRVSNTVRITVRDVTAVEQVISTAVGAGANTIYNFNFGIEDTAALEHQARLDAVANARARAEQLAEALGVTVGEPVVITESYGSQPVRPLPYGVGGGAMMDVASLPIQTGQLQVTVHILVTFRISQ